jgi:hypothetical protein
MLFVRATLWMALCLALAAPAAAEIGRIKSFVGAASIERKGTRITAKVGMPVLPGDVIATGKDGRVSLAFIDQTRFAVGPNSRVALDKFDYDVASQRGTFETKVERGRVAIVSGRIAKSRRDAMKVRTPVTLLGVRGTNFVVDVP